jgi:tetratricopeptide (TPR) repeat protein
MGNKRQRAILALFLACLLAAPPARAESGGDAELRARAHFQQGQVHFEARQFGEAIREYQAGYDISRRSGFLLNIGHAYRRMGDLEAARLHYKKFLFVDPTSPKRAEVEATIRQLDELGTAASAPPGPPAVGIAAAPGRAAPEPRPILSATAEPATSQEPPPFYRRLWFWSAVGVVVLGGAVAAYAVGTRSSAPGAPEASWGTLRR